MTAPSTARANASRFATDGAVNPLILRTYCSAAARISSPVDGGSKLNSTRMFLHTVPPVYFARRFQMIWAISPRVALAFTE
jgi:hypothetical protein